MSEGRNFPVVQKDKARVFGSRTEAEDFFGFGTFGRVQQVHIVYAIDNFRLLFSNESIALEYSYTRNVVLLSLKNMARRKSDRHDPRRYHFVREVNPHVYEFRLVGTCIILWVTFCT